MEISASSTAFGCSESMAWPQPASRNTLAWAQPFADRDAGPDRRHLIRFAHNHQGGAAHWSSVGIRVEAVAGVQVRMKDAGGGGFQQAFAAAEHPQPRILVGAQPGLGAVAPAVGHVDGGVVVIPSGVEQRIGDRHGRRRPEQRQGPATVRMPRRQRIGDEGPHAMPHHGGAVPNRRRPWPAPPKQPCLEWRSAFGPSLRPWPGRSGAKTFSLLRAKWRAGITQTL